MGLLLASGCDSDTTAPGSDSFHLAITVVDSAGAPQAGLRVSARNKVSGVPAPVVRARRAAAKPPPSEFFLYPCYPNPYVGTTVVELDVPTFCAFRLTFVNLGGETVDTFVEDSAEAGKHVLVWPSPDTTGNVYLCRFTAGPVDSPLFVDSTWLASWPPAPEDYVLGFTDSRGVIATRDSVRFPSLFDLPEMAWTNETGPDTLGLFRFLDTLEILLTDTLNGHDQPYLRPIGPGPNSIELLWAP